MKIINNQDFNSLLVQDVMTRALIPMKFPATALQVAKMMAEVGIRALFVQDYGNPVGIVTDRDCNKNNCKQFTI